MTVQMNIAEAKGKLSELVARAEAGEEVVLSRNGKAVATIKPVSTAVVRPTGKRQLGLWEHLNLDIPDDLFIGPDEETMKWVDRPLFPSDDDAAA